MVVEILKIIACVFGFYVLKFNLLEVKLMTYTFYNFLPLPPSFDEEPSSSRFAPTNKAARRRLLFVGELGGIDFVSASSLGLFALTGTLPCASPPCLLV